MTENKVIIVGHLYDNPHLKGSGPFESRQYNASFCCDACKRAFNNRRAQRGAILYDLVMIEACDPKAFEANKLANLRVELVQRWRKEDEAANRKRTWKRANDVMYDTASMLR